MKKHREHNLETPITQMIDIVFLLIIFFVVTASVDEDVVDQNVHLAIAKYAPAIEKNDPRSVVINLRDNGSINIAMQPMTLQQLQQMLIAMQQQSGSAIPIILRCDASTQYRYIDRIMQIAASAGLYRVRISAMVDE